VNTTILVDASEFWSRFRDDIASAKENVYIQTLSFEGDTVGLDLSKALIACHAADRRIIVDHYTRFMLNDRFLYLPINRFDAELQKEVAATREMVTHLRTSGIGVKFVNPMGLLLCRFPARNHKKIITIDGTISYIGGLNFSEHNFRWHDMMLRIESRDIAEYLGMDFRSTWEGYNYGGRKRFGEVVLHALDGKNNRQEFDTVLSLINNARSSIYVQSPYLSFPFCDRLRAAVERGVRVAIVTPEENNKRQIGEYIRWEAARSGFDLWLYPDRMTHLKAMLIDNNYLIAGSSNFDLLSSLCLQETIAVITDRAVIEEFKAKVVAPDFACCRRAENLTAGVRGYLRNLQLKSVGRFSAMVSSGS